MGCSNSCCYICGKELSSFSFKQGKIHVGKCRLQELGRMI